SSLRYTTLFRSKASLNKSFGNSRFPAHFYNNLLLTTERLYQAGVPILAGSDAPNPTTAHGWSLLVELDMLQRAGLPLESVLHAATAAPRSEERRVGKERGSR